ncbi:MAG: CpaD family pilus assembly protein [Neomegalonema sp.]|nr:CpaD family pilus assembly protein [Neomegalonema sp.]
MADVRTASSNVRPQRSLARPALLGAALLAACGLGGCAQFEGGGRYDAVYPIKIEAQPTILRTPNVARLSVRDARRIDALGRDYLRLGKGPISIGWPKGANASAAVGKIAKRLHRVGVPLRSIRRGAYDPAEYKSADILVFFTRPTAVAQPCPRLWGETIMTPRNSGSGRFGCFYQRNLAAMVADPRDLEAPAPMTLAPAGPRLRVHAAHEMGKITSSEESAKSLATTK